MTDTTPADIIERVQEQQRQLKPSPTPLRAPSYHPDLMVIGCIDARLNPRNDIGILRGCAEIYRNISATVPPNDGSQASIDMAAALHHAIEEKQVRDIAIMGHTACGGLQACLYGPTQALPKVGEHLRPYMQARERVIAAGGSQPEQEYALENAAVAQSVANLLTYDVVKPAVVKGAVTLHGWVIDTATQRIREMPPVTAANMHVDEGHPVFAPMVTLDKRPKHLRAGGTTLEMIRYTQKFREIHPKQPPYHNPTAIILTDLDNRINPTRQLKIKHGEVLIHRDLDPCGPSDRLSQEAALEFAINAKKVRDVVLMLHTDSDQYAMRIDPSKPLTDHELKLRDAMERQAEEKALRGGIQKIKQYQAVAAALTEGRIHIHGWLIDTTTRLIQQMDMDTGQFHPMGYEPHAKAV